MKLAELSAAVSKQVKADEATVRRTLRVAISLLREEIAKEPRFSLQGLGSFVSREGKEPGNKRIVFRPMGSAKDKDAD